MANVYESLGWLPAPPVDFYQQVANAESCQALVRLVKHALDDNQLRRISKKLKSLRERGADSMQLPIIKFGIIGNSTTQLLEPTLVGSALRFGILLDVIHAEFNQLPQVAFSERDTFTVNPMDVVLVSVDHRSLPFVACPGDVVKAQSNLEDCLEYLMQITDGIHKKNKSHVMLQNFAPLGEDIFGSYERRLPGTLAWLINQLNTRLDLLNLMHVSIVDIAGLAANVGVANWHNQTLWHLGKIPFAPKYNPIYGDWVMRLVAARLGRSRRCLILDLDNTLWGGTIGDDGLNGIVLGPGSAEGEAFAHFQSYAKSLTRQGVLLAVCSKNDLANVMEVFEKHPEMVLRTPDIAAFRVNWTDKATNLREIARELNIGLDALAFVDDNPFERSIVRSELPMVRTLELPDEPALFAQCVADSGAFDLTHVTAEDRKRSELYVLRRDERAAMSEQTDLAGYLASLDMTLHWSHFRPVDLQRVTQLANKTNQFNLRTRRYTLSEVEQCLQDPDALTLQFRLTDRLADHGIISILIGRRDTPGTLFIETWLMSCRVIGREVEQAIVAVTRRVAEQQGIRTLIGEYLPTAKNQMVSDLYGRLGFTLLEDTADRRRWSLDIPSPPSPTRWPAR